MPHKSDLGLMTVLTPLVPFVIRIRPLHGEHTRCPYIAPEVLQHIWIVFEGGAGPSSIPRSSPRRWLSVSRITPEVSLG
jgi:hypothetical protein